MPVLTLREESPRGTPSKDEPQGRRMNRVLLLHSTANLFLSRQVFDPVRRQGGPGAGLHQPVPGCPEPGRGVGAGFQRVGKAPRSQNPHGRLSGGLKALRQHGPLGLQTVHSGLHLGGGHLPVAPAVPVAAHQLLRTGYVQGVGGEVAETVPALFVQLVNLTVLPGSAGDWLPPTGLMIPLMALMA